MQLERACAVQARMRSTNQAHFSTSEDVHLRIKHIISTSEDMQYEHGGTSSVQARKCCTNQAHHQYKGKCAVQIRHIISTREEQSRSSNFGTVEGGGDYSKILIKK